MLVLGDAHAADPENRAALLAAYDDADADVAIQLGDLEWYDLPVPTWFIAGNNEDFEVTEAMRAGETPPGVTNAHLLASTATEIEGLRIGGLSGNFAPTRYDRARSDLVGERRRHFTHEDVERLAELEDIDLLLTHEAPNGLLSYGYDPGCDHVDDLIATLDPDLVLVGHHHSHHETTVHGTRVVGLAPAWQCYYLLDPVDLTLQVRETPG